MYYKCTRYYLHENEKKNGILNLDIFCIEYFTLMLRYVSNI